MDEFSFELRPLEDKDVSEHADLLYSSFNHWYWKHGWGRDYFSCDPQETRIFYDIYKAVSPGSSVAAYDRRSGRMMGSCFFHPREHHVSLGIMSVHPNYAGAGVGRCLVDHILSYVKEHGYRSCRLVSSAMNVDSFSLYNRAGFIPRVSYNDMVVEVAPSHFDSWVQGADRIRDACPKDVPGMADIEMEVSHIQREIDYQYAIDEGSDHLHASIYESDQGQVEGFMISVRHPALNMLGPCVARSQEVALALIQKAMQRFEGEVVLMVIPMQDRVIIEQMYAWGAINVETHLKEVWGEFHEFRGVNMPSFLPETG